MKWTTNGPVPSKFSVTVEGVRLSGKTTGQLFNQFRRHYDQNDLRLPINWESFVWTALAAAYPKHVKRAPGGAKRRLVSVGSALNFLRFMAKRVVDSSLVAPQEAHRRASICRGCPLRSSVAGCSTCKDALKLTIHPPEKVDAPEACGACGCYLPLKVWVPRDQLGSADAFPFWSGCWMKEE
jgi:hypothetical protein